MPAAAVEQIAEKVFSHQRISTDDALHLFQHTNLNELASLANFRRQHQAPGGTCAG